MPGATFIQGERVDLKTVEEEDLEFLQKGLNHPSIRHFLNSTPTNGFEMRRRFEEFVSDERGINLVVVPRAGDFEGQRVGHVWINPIKEREDSGIIGLWFLPEAQRNKYAQDAMLHLIDHAFEQVGLRRLEINTADTNRVIQRLSERAGFEHEVQRREAEFVDGEYVTHHKYGLLAEDWVGLDELLEKLYRSSRA